MEIVIVIILAVLVVLLIGGQNKRRREGNGAYGAGGRAAHAPWPAEGPPAGLGVPAGHPARPAAERLEAALGADFEERVKDRVLKAQPRLSDAEWSWTWFELKRYFLISGIARNVPMYSRQADAVWHEMLMFTREYEEFCRSFCGEMIHHAPHAPGYRPEPGDRAWFDWLYGELFGQSPVSGRIWGPFYRTAFSRDRLLDMERLGEPELRERLFRTSAVERYPDDFGLTVDYLLERMGGQLLAARDKSYDGRRERRDTDDTAMMGMGMLSGLLLYNSVLYPDDIERQMLEAQTEEQRRGNGDAAVYGGGSNADWDQDAGEGNGRDSGNGGDSGGDGGSSGWGGDGGGSSGGDSGGSSCGSGCSS